MNCSSEAAEQAFLKGICRDNFEREAYDNDLSFNEIFPIRGAYQVHPLPGLAVCRKSVCLWPNNYRERERNCGG